MSAEVRSPFDLTANLHAYVPREAIEGCLRVMVRALRAGVCRMALTGPTGHGKTLVLQMIADRVGDELGVVYLPYGALPPADLCTWALGRMEAPKCDDPIETLVTLARDLKENGKALLLLIDDANTLSLETARWLSKISEELAGGLRVVVAATDGPLVEPVLEAFGPDVERFRLDEPLTLSETQQYIKTRLAISGAPDSTRALFDDATIRALHRSSEGVARQIHQLASAAIRGLPFDRLDRVPAGETTDFDPAAPSKEKPKTKRKSRRKKGKAGAKSEAAATLNPESERQQSSASSPLDEQPPDPALPCGTEESASASVHDRRDWDPEPFLLEDVIFCPERDTLRRPPIVTMAAPTRWRVFRSSLIIALALIGAVLARPAAELRDPSTPREEPAVTDGLPQPKKLIAPNHAGLDVTSVPRPVAHPTLGNLRQTLLANEPETDSSAGQAGPVPSDPRLVRGRSQTRRWRRLNPDEDSATPPAAPAP